MKKSTNLRVYNPIVLRILCASALAMTACAAHDLQPYLSSELAFLKPGVRMETEEREVRRVLAQRGMRVVARLTQPTFIALGARARGNHISAVRVISQRGVVIAEDGALDDLFAPARITLLEHFGGTFGEYIFIASARIPRGREVGCVMLHRLLPDGSAVDAVLDVGLLGARACVSNLAPARAGRVRATIAWPTLHAITTPQLDGELAIVEPKLGQPSPAIPVFKLVDQGDWIEEERIRLSTIRLARAPFSDRHAAGVARAALARIAGQTGPAQVAAYRHAIARILPGSPEAEIVADTLAHIERGWMDPASDPDSETEGKDEEGALEPSPDDVIIIDPELIQRP